MPPTEAVTRPEAPWKEKYYRLEKVIALADVISWSGITVEVVGEEYIWRQLPDPLPFAPTEEFWRHACRGARFAADYSPSPLTRAAVERRLWEFQECGKRLAAMKREAL
jgi:hypothetical protein